MSDDQSWYYAKGEEKIGPITSAELRQLAASGELKPTDSVWKTEWPEWKKANSLKGLFPSGPSSPPPQRSEKSVQTIQAATEAADQVSKKFWFLDLRFESFATPRLIGIVFAASLVALTLIFFGSVAYFILNVPIIQAVFSSVTSLILCSLLAVWIRVCLELCLLGFRVAENLRYLRHLESLGKPDTDL